MSQTDINILLRATDQASSVIDSAASKLSGNMAKIEDANKKVTQTSDKVGASSKTVALAFNNLATSGMALYNAYDRIRDSQVQVDRANLMVQSTLNSLNDAQRRYNKVVAESGVGSEKAEVAAADLSLAQERYRVACERAEMSQSHLNQSMVQAALTVIPSLVTMISSLATMTKSWTSATEMAGVALTFLQAHPIILVIAAIAELVAVLVIAYQRSEAFRNGVNKLSVGLLTFKAQVKETEKVVEGLTWAQIQWLQSFEDLKKMAPSTANAINGFADAIWRAEHGIVELDSGLKTMTAEYENAKKAINAQILSLEALVVVQIGRDREGRKEPERNIWIAETILMLRREMDDLDKSYKNATEDIKKKIAAQEEEKRTQELLTDLTDRYNLSVAEASLEMTSYGQDFSAAFGAGRINDALNVAKRFAAEFSISINDAIRILEGFSTEAETSFVHLSEAAKVYLTGEAQDNIEDFKDCATSKLEMLKGNMENLDIFEAIKLASGKLPGIPEIQGTVVGETAGLPVYNPAVQERLSERLGGMAGGGIVTQPLLTWLGERGPEAVIPLNKASGLGNVTVQFFVTGALDNATVDYAVSRIKGLLENVTVENSSAGGASTHKRIRWEA